MGQIEQLYERLNRLHDDQIVIICGPTASGKSQLAVNIAKTLQGIIINGDAIQVYKELPILTSSPLTITPYVEHILYNIIPCSQAFSVQDWLNLAYNEISYAFQNKKRPIVVSGSGMYVKALIEGISYVPEISDFFRAKAGLLIKEIGVNEMYNLLAKADPELASRLKPTDSQRIMRGLEVFWQTNIPLSEWQKVARATHYQREKFFIVLLLPDRAKLYNNINQRFLQMLDLGVLQEVKALAKGVLHKAIGFKEIRAYLEETMTYSSMISIIQQLTRNYAKRQITWFRNQITPDIVLNDLQY